MEKLTYTLVLIILMLTSTVNADNYVDPEIFDKLDVQDEVQVIVVLRGVDNITEIKGNSRTEKFANYLERSRINRIAQEEILSKYPSREFRPKYISSTGLWFSGYSTRRGIEILSKDESVIKVLYNGLVHAGLNVSVPLINANYVQDSLGYKGEGEVICVLDTGVNSSHPALEGRILDEYCYCSIAGGCCSGGVSESSDASDDSGHGTHVTGIIISNDSVYTGVAPEAKVVAIKVLNATGSGLWDDVRAGIEWCLDNASKLGISIISASIWNDAQYNETTTCPSYIDEKINDSYNLDIPFITITGDGWSTVGISYPGCSPHTIAVGASTDSDSISLITDRNEWMDLLAPGSNIISPTIIHGVFHNCNDSDGDGYVECSGTSMAAPHVAGAAAILHQLNSSLTPDMIKRILGMTGKPIEDTGEGGTGFTFPRIDVLEAVKLINRSQILTVSNNGTRDLVISMINSTQSWITVYPQSITHKRNV